MIKVLFLQNKGKSIGGVAQVNKLVSEYLVNDGYDVSIVSIRDNVTDKALNYDEKIHIKTLNTKDLWGSFTYNQILNDLKKLKIQAFIKKIIHRLHNNYTMYLDKKKLKEYIDYYQPDYIISTHYQLLDMLPSSVLFKTYHEQHSSFRDATSHMKTIKTLLKYQDKIRFIWLSKNTMEDAIKLGFNNSIYIYNAVRFETNEKALVTNNKKLVTIARLSSEKRIDMMVEIVNEIFKNSKYCEWTLEIYGEGDQKDLIQKKINSSQIKLMGVTTNPEKVLMSSSINLNTSIFEGFSLSILEAAECGIPTVTFDFGESVSEEIIDGKTGFIAKDKEDYINKLKKLMDDNMALEQMSTNAKQYNKKFRINNIIKDWEEELKER